ncbi:MAG: MFS transporter [Haloferacaceae archaeon]
MLAKSLLGSDADLLRERDFRALLAANLLAPLGIPLVSPLLESLSGPFGVSTARLGLLISAYTAPPILLIPVAGVLADRYGRKPVLLAGILLFGAAGTAIAFTTDFRVAVALRFVQGVAYAGLTPVIVTSLGDLYAGSREASAQGLRFTTSGLYQSVFPPAAGVLVAVAWQYPFLIYALAFPVAGAVYLWFDEPLDRDGERTDGGSTADDPDGATDAPPDADADDGLWALARLATRRRVVALVVARGLPSLAWTGFLTYNSFFVVRAIGGSPAAAGVLVTVNSAMLAVGGSQAGRITSAWDSRFLPLVVTTTGLGCGLALIAVAPSLPVAAAGAALLGVSFGVSLSLYRSVVTGIAPQALRGGLVSVSESVGRAGSTLTPVGMGAVVAVLAPTYGVVAAVRWTAVGVGALVAAVGCLCLVVARLSPPTPAEAS